MNKEKSILKEIFNSDPDELLKSKQQENITDKEQLVQNFKQISNFYEKYNREPQPNNKDFYEFQLYARLNNLKKNEIAVKYLKNSDKHGLLFLDKKKIASFEDIFKDDPDGLLNNDENDLFNLKGPIKEFDRAKTDFVAKRKPCKDFNKYEDRFKKLNLDITEGKRQLIPFKENNLKENNFFIHNGIVFLLEKIDIFEKKQTFSSGERKRMDGRTRCIFDNGTESNMKYRSLVKILNQNGKAITENIDDVNKEFEKEISEDNTPTGVIYVLKSKSKDQKISSIEDLYKIGYTKDIKKRLKNAEKDPTFLMAEVDTIATYNVYDVPAITIESIIQKFFKSCQLKLEIIDNKKKQYKPDEWYVVPFEVIEQAIVLLNKNKISNYKYDMESMSIIPRKK